MVVKALQSLLSLVRRLQKMSVDDSRPRSRSPSKDKDSNNFHDRVYEPEQEQYSSVDFSTEVYPTSTSTSENQTTTLTNGIPADPEFNLKCRLFIGSLSFAVCLSGVVYIFSCY